MTSRQQAQELLAQIPEHQLAQAIKFMTDLLNKKSTNDSLPKADPQELHREFEALIAELSKSPVLDIDATRASAMAEKYGKYN